MITRRARLWLKTVGLVSGGGVLFQLAGCDPDLALQAALQFLTETAIFVTDNVLVGLR